MPKKYTIVKLWSNFDQYRDESHFQPLKSFIQAAPRRLQIRFGSETKTLLLHLCAIVPSSAEESQLIIKALQQFLQYDNTASRIYDTDKQGNTVIHLAIKANHLDLLRVLLNSINYLSHFRKVNKQGESPVALARNLWRHDVGALVEHHIVAKMLPEEEAGRILTFDDYINIRQQQLISKSSVNHGPVEISEPGRVISSAIFCENEGVSADIYAHELMKLCQNGLIRPILELIALCIRGKHKEDPVQYILSDSGNMESENLALHADILAYAKAEKKAEDKLSVFFFDIENMASIFLVKSEDTICTGSYFPRNFSISLAIKGSSKEEILQDLVHEFCHCVAHVVYNNKCKPYEFYDSDDFESIVSELREEFKKRQPDYYDKAFFTIATVFSAYPEEQQAAELIVRVPEIMTLLGYEAGSAWLQKYTPRLFVYYKDTFIVDINRRLSYLSQENSETGLERISDFAEEIADSQPSEKKEEVRVAEIGGAENRSGSAAASPILASHATGSQRCWNSSCAFFSAATATIVAGVAYMVSEYNANRLQ